MENFYINNRALMVNITNPLARQAELKEFHDKLNKMLSIADEIMGKMEDDEDKEKAVLAFVLQALMLLIKDVGEEHGAVTESVVERIESAYPELNDYKYCVEIKGSGVSNYSTDVPDFIVCSITKLEDNDNG